MPFIIDKLGQLTGVSLLVLLKGPPILISSLFSLVKTLLGLTVLNTLDAGIFIVNCLTPKKPKGQVVAKGDPGYGGKWPEFREPKEHDSRSPCPYLNALANHGIIDRSGRNISMDDLRPAIQKTLNTSFTLTLNTANGVNALFGKSTIDLADLNRHGIIEHDGSAIRADAYFQPNQALPSKPIILALLASASSTTPTGSPRLTAQDIATFTLSRLADSRINNPEFSPTGLSAFHTLFMCNNLSLLLDTVDGDVKALEMILLEERFPEGWETSFRGRLGHTNLEMELRSLEIWLRMH